MVNKNIKSSKFGVYQLFLSLVKFLHNSQFLLPRKKEVRDRGAKMGKAAKCHMRIIFAKTILKWVTTSRNKLGMIGSNTISTDLSIC
jgi:hypothetical protein